MNSEQGVCDIRPLYSRIDELLLQKKSIAIAIDGNSASGKSSLAALLKPDYSCNVIHMDDFFLRPSQRTPARLKEPGGNIDYERFGKEVIRPLKAGEMFSYRPYNCRTMELSEPVIVNPNRINVIEGVYSLHPHFIEAYDIKVFLSLDETVQRRRLSERNAEIYERFVNEWIPMETGYFEFFRISEKCDFIFDTSLKTGVALL